MSVMEDERAHDHDFRGLLEFLALLRYIGDAGGTLAVLVVIDPDNLGSGPEFEVRLAHQDRKDRCLGTGFGIVPAAVFFAKAAIAALSEGYAEGIGIGLRHVRGCASKTSSFGRDPRLSG